MPIALSQQQQQQKKIEQTNEIKEHIQMHICAKRDGSDQEREWEGDRNKNRISSISYVERLDRWFETCFSCIRASWDYSFLFISLPSPSFLTSSFWHEWLQENYKMYSLPETKMLSGCGVVQVSSQNVKKICFRLYSFLFRLFRFRDRRSSLSHLYSIISNIISVCSFDVVFCVWAYSVFGYG